MHELTDAIAAVAIFLILVETRLPIAGAGVFAFLAALAAGGAFFKGMIRKCAKQSIDC